MEDVAEAANYLRVVDLWGGCCSGSHMERRGREGCRMQRLFNEESNEAGWDRGDGCYYAKGVSGHGLEAT